MAVRESVDGRSVWLMLARDGDEVKNLALERRDVYGMDGDWRELSNHRRFWVGVELGSSLGQAFGLTPLQHALRSSTLQ